MVLLLVSFNMTVNLGEKCHVNITERVIKIREHHMEYVTHLSRLSNGVCNCFLLITF